MLDRTDGVNLLYAGKVHWISGEPEGNKSWLAQIATADAIMDGLVAFYVDFEDGPGALVGRLRALGASDEAIATRLRYYRPESPMTVENVVHIIADAAKRHPALSVIDGVNAAMGASDFDPNKNTEFYQWWNMLGGPLRKLTSGPMVAIDHVVKNPEARAQYASGTGQKLAAVDVHLGLEVVNPFGRGLTTRVNIILLKDRPGLLRRHAGKWSAGHGAPLGRLVMESDPDTGLIRFAIEAPEAAATTGFRPTELMEKISQFVGRNHDGPPPAKKGIEEGVSGKAEYKRLALDVLVREGYLTAVPKGNHAVYLSAKPYRQLDDPGAGKTAAPRPETLRSAGHLGQGRPGSSAVVPDESSAGGRPLVPPFTGDEGEPGLVGDTGKKRVVPGSRPYLQVVGDPFENTHENLMSLEVSQPIDPGEEEPQDPEPPDPDEVRAYDVRELDPDDLVPIGVTQ